MNIKNEREFYCECCKGTFVSERSDKEARKEKQQNFGDMPFMEMALVCTDCFVQIMAYAKKIGLHS